MTALAIIGMVSLLIVWQGICTYLIITNVMHWCATIDSRAERRDSEAREERVNQAGGVEEKHGEW